MGFTKPVDVKAVEEYLKKNPDSTYAEFLEKGRTKISDCYFYMLRRKVNGVTPYSSRKKSNVYVRIFKTDSNGITEQSKNLLKQFVDSLNVINNARMEIIEYSNPPQIEVREMKKF